MLLQSNDSAYKVFHIAIFLALRPNGTLSQTYPGDGMWLPSEICMQYIAYICI